MYETLTHISQSSRVGKAISRAGKTFCSVGNHNVATRTAIVYSLVDNCKALGVDSRKWCSGREKDAPVKQVLHEKNIPESCLP